jgi:hypothetical protein
MSDTFKSGRGGAREGSGRPAKPESEKAKKRHLTLNQALIDACMVATGISRPNTAVKTFIERQLKAIVTSND